MSLGSTRIFGAALGLAMLALGCGNTVEDVCEDLGQCSDVDQTDCLADGQKLESAAESRGCEDAFEAYIDCVADVACSWRGSCSSERAALEACAGAFP